MEIVFGIVIFEENFVKKEVTVVLIIVLARQVLERDLR